MHFSLKLGPVHRTAVAAGVGGLLLAGLLSFTAPALALPEGRQYELVSPLYKAGYGASEIDAVSLEGDRIAYYSQGAFAETPGGPTGSANYMARRGASGWSTVPLLPPAGLAFSNNYDFSSTLESVLLEGKAGPNSGWAALEQEGEEFVLHNTSAPDTESYWEVAGGITLKTLDESESERERGVRARYEGASPDLCQILFATGEPLVPRLAATSTASQLYDLSRGCSGSEPSLRLVGLDNDSVGEGRLISPSCVVELGNIGSSSGGGKDSAFNAVAAGGGAVFFTEGVEESAGQCRADHHQLFVRLGGSRTVEVSRAPEAGRPFGGCEREGVAGEVPCAGAAARPAANFAGANEAGTVVFFTSPSSLELGAPEDLYVARLGCPEGAAGCGIAEREVLSATPVSVGVNGGEATGVRGVVRVAPDGSRVYYVATGVLSKAVDSEDQPPVAGADNLYVYDSNSGETGFVADLCSGSERSGGVEDVRCPVDLNEAEIGGVNDSYLWGSHGTFESEVQTAGADGQYLVFSSYGRLTADDTGDAKNIYRYDAATGELDRVSVGEEGADNDGNGGMANATIAWGSPGGSVVGQYEMSSRAISEDGSRIVFSTARPLSERAGNGLVNVYEWRREPGWSKGRVSMVSCGCSPESDKQVVISPSGQDIFFTSAADLVAQNTDGLLNVYDAHECGASAPCFAAAPGEVEPCEGDACQGPLTNPAPLLVPGSVSQAPGQNFAAPSSATAVKPKPKSKPAQCKKGRVKRKDRCVVKRSKAGKAGADRGAGR